MRHDETDDLILNGASIMKPGVRPPEVSVILVNRDCSRLIGVRLASIRAETYPHFDCVVAGNGSHA